MNTIEQVKYLYSILPERFIAYNWKAKGSVLLGVSEEKITDLLRKMEALEMTKQVGTFEFEKRDRTQKPVRLEDLSD